MSVARLDNDIHQPSRDDDRLPDVLTRNEALHVVVGKSELGDPVLVGIRRR